MPIHPTVDDAPHGFDAQCEDQRNAYENGPGKDHKPVDVVILMIPAPETEQHQPPDDTGSEPISHDTPGSPQTAPVHQCCWHVRSADPYGSHLRFLSATTARRLRLPVLPVYPSTGRRAIGRKSVPE